jgi:hypothetical protein
MFFNNEAFFPEIWNYRILWLSGRNGGGKTALSYAISEEKLKKGYRLISNNRSVWQDDFEAVTLDENNHLRAVIILDEGGLYFKNNAQIEELTAFCAKMDITVIIPSRFPPCREACRVKAQAVWNLKAVGLPIIVYKWRISYDQEQDHGWFLWVNPGYYYGIYSRQDPGSRGDEIVRWLVGQKDAYVKRYGRESLSSDVLSTVVPKTKEDKLADTLNDVASSFEESSDRFETLSQRINKRKR